MEELKRKGCGRHHVDLLAFHWLMALSSLDRVGPHDRLRVTETALIEALAGYFAYGLLRAANQTAQERFKPRAHFGVRSNLRDESSETSAQVFAPCLFPSPCPAYGNGGLHVDSARWKGAARAVDETSCPCMPFLRYERDRARRRWHN